MVFKDYTFFSYVFLATAVILLIGQAHGAGLCDNSPNKQICYSIVYNRTDPREASIAAVHKLVYQSKVAKVVAKTQNKSTEIDYCISKFDSSIVYLKYSLNAMSIGDYRTLRTYIIQARIAYNGCDSEFRTAGKPNPIAKSTKFLEDMTYVGAYLATLIK
ncbi:hypothetical protein SO802_012608 [Lithocarpus litseifolius]|uniref:Pectinesterase inhibitor domain-containing protein n=1 Tax=Lithocarpus litseifolius TaxID=425828 RepID=A0AAW2D381_9ROSI